MTQITVPTLPVLTDFAARSPEHPWTANEQLTQSFSRIHCATGARPQHIPGYQAGRDFHVLAWIAECALKAERTEVIFEGGADGWDQATSHAARDLGIYRVLNAPFNGQHALWKNPNVVRRYADLLDTADHAYAVADPDRNDKKAVVRALMDRNVEMLRWGCQGVLPFNPPEREHEGGTAACLREARKRGCRILPNLYPEWEKYQSGELRVLHEIRNTELSNMAVLDKPIRMAGEDYATLEHYFQAAKTTNPAQRQLIRNAATPAEARRLGRSVTLREDWDTLRLDVMHAGLRKKFAQPRFAAALAATGDALILEGNTWNDEFWGVCKGVGRNHLGRLLMQIRETL
ncbi:NADAR family protein (plasmid) [Deinococcus sp. VB343]|uniref:NADAR family protein n=1 Tax=Deinococcus sp. VB343 TaxID=3385567 RepID=UPI0039C8F68E